MKQILITFVGLLFLLLITIAGWILTGNNQISIQESVRTNDLKALQKHLKSGAPLDQKVVYGHLLLEVKNDKVLKVLRDRTKHYRFPISRVKAISSGLIAIDLSDFNKNVSEAYEHLISAKLAVEFGLVHRDSEALIANDITPSGFKKFSKTRRDPQGNLYIEEVLVELPNTYGLKGEQIADARPSRDPINSNPLVLFTFNSEGSAAMERLSGNNIGRALAIIIDGELMSMPVLQEQISSHGQITGDFTMKEANIISLGLVNPLTQSLDIEERYTDSEMSLEGALLRISILHNYTEIIEMLIENRPEAINAIGSNKETALDFALKHFPEAADLLRKHGAKTGEGLKAERQ